MFFTVSHSSTRCSLAATVAVREDARGSYNSYLAEQLKEKADEACWSLTLFGGSDVIQLVDGLPVADVPPLGRDEYVPDGFTPLYDSMGRTMGIP